MTIRATQGALLGLAAAALFGLSAPLSKLLLSETSPLLLAGIFYLASGSALTLYRVGRPAPAEAALRGEDVPAIAGLVLLGGMLGPVLMLWGLSRVSALTGSLLLNLEAPFTMLVAVALFREHMGRQAILAAALILVGAAVLRFQPSDVVADGWGVLAIATACLAWAFDNNLTQRLTSRDPFAVVRVKALVAGGANLCLGVLGGTSLPPVQIVALAALVGVFSYGVSIVLDAYALRFVGAAREAAFFATAPFIGALASVLLLHEALQPWDAASMALMVAGVGLLLRERHGHAHAHDSVSHEHGHTHDAHHQHAHGPLDPTSEPHTHMHQHEPLVHDHPHAPDLHHRHRHRH